MEGFERRRSPVEQFCKTKKPVYNPWEEFLIGASNWDDYTTLPNPLDSPASSTPLDQTATQMRTSEELRQLRRELGKYAGKLFRVIEGE